MNDDDSLKQLLEITEQHLLAEFSHEKTEEYKRRLQELVGKVLHQHPEYKEGYQFKKLLKLTDEYLQKEISHNDDLQYCRELSKFLCDTLKLWRIESVSLTKKTKLPSKEEMEKLLPSKWPLRWDEIEKESADGIINVKLGHISPYPEHVEHPSIKLATVADYSTDGKKGIVITKYDFIANLSITGYGDKQDARQFFESYFNDFISFDNKVPGAAFDINIGDLLEAFAPEELVKEAKQALDKAQKSLSKSGIKTKRGKFLGEEALFVRGKNGVEICQAVIINNFIVMGDILGYPLLPPGNKPIHSCGCKGARGEDTDHSACSTLQAEDFIHREKVESLLRDVIARIKGKTIEPSKEVIAEIIRGQNKIKNPEETSRIEKGDIIRTNSNTQINLTDGAGNKITIGGNTEIKIENSNNLKLMVGSITTFFKKIKPQSKFEIHTPICVAGIRGTIFSLWTDGKTTSLTVVEGEVEFSDLKGNRVIVISNQTCVCSKERGLQRPVTLPINLKKNFKEM